jgi:hypothetical protein
LLSRSFRFVLSLTSLTKVHVDQAAIFEMVDAIRFSETVAKPKIVSRVEIVLRPFIDGQFDKPRLPLIIEAA